MMGTRTDATIRSRGRRFVVGDACVSLGAAGVGLELPLDTDGVGGAGDGLTAGVGRGLVTGVTARLES